MKRVQQLFLVSVLALFGATAKGEVEPTLEIVLRAIQERYAAVTQRQAVEQAWGDSDTVFSSNPDLTIFTQADTVTPRAPIDWGPGIPASPPDDFFDTWTLRQRLDVLEIAYSELEALMGEYLNVDPQGFVGGNVYVAADAFTSDATVGLVENKGWAYSRYDLPIKTELIDHSDYRDHLYHMSDLVSRLRCLSWPVPVYRRRMPVDSWWDGFIRFYSTYQGSDPFDYLNRYRPWQGSQDPDTTAYPEYIGLHNLKNIEVAPADEVSTATFVFKNAAYSSQALTMMQNMVGLMDNWSTFAMQKNIRVGDGRFNTAMFEIPALEMTIIENEGNYDYFLEADDTFSAGGIRYFNDGVGLLSGGLPGDLYKLEHLTQETRLTIEKNDIEIEAAQETIFIQGPDVAPTGRWITQAQAVTSGVYEQDPLVYGRPEGDLEIQLSPQSLVPGWNELIQNDNPWTFIWKIIGEDYPTPLPPELYYDMYEGPLNGYLPDEAQGYLSDEAIQVGFTEQDVGTWKNLTYLAGVNTYSVFVPQFTELSEPLSGAKTGPLILGEDRAGMTPADPDCYYSIDLGSGRHTRSHNARLVLVFRDDGGYDLVFLGDRAEYDTSASAGTTRVYAGEALSTYVSYPADGSIHVNQILTRDIPGLVGAIAPVSFKLLIFNKYDHPNHPEDIFVNLQRINHASGHVDHFLLGNREVKTNKQNDEYLTTWGMGEPYYYPYSNNRRWSALYSWSHSEEVGGTIEEVLREEASAYFDEYQKISGFQTLTQTGLEPGVKGYSYSFRGDAYPYPGGEYHYSDAFTSTGHTQDHDDDLYVWTSYDSSQKWVETLDDTEWEIEHVVDTTPVSSTRRTETATGYQEVVSLGSVAVQTNVVERWVPPVPQGQVPWGLKKITSPDQIVTVSDVYGENNRVVTRFEGGANGDGVTTVETYNLLGNLLNRTSTLSMDGVSMTLYDEDMTHGFFGVATTEDSHGNQVAYGRNSRGFLISRTGYGVDTEFRDHDALGRPRTVEYPEMGLTAQITRELNRTVVSAGQWSQAYDFNSAGVVTNAVHSGSRNGELTLSILPDGTLSTTATDGLSHLSRRETFHPETLEGSGDVSGESGFRETVAFETLNGIPCRVVSLVERDVDENGTDTFSLVVSKIYTDGLGRVRRVRTLDPSAETVAYLDTDYQYNANGRLWRIVPPAGAGPGVIYEYHDMGYIQFETVDLNGDGVRNGDDRVLENEVAIVDGKLTATTYLHIDGVKTPLERVDADVLQRIFHHSTGTRTPEKVSVDNQDENLDRVSVNDKVVLEQNALSRTVTNPVTTELEDPSSTAETWDTEGRLTGTSFNRGTLAITESHEIENGEEVVTIQDGETQTERITAYNAADLSSTTSATHDEQEGKSETRLPLADTRTSGGKGDMPFTVSTSRTPGKGTRLEIERSNGVPTVMTFNPAGLPVRREFGNGDWEAWGYTPGGDIATAANSRNQTATWEYNPVSGKFEEYRIGNEHGQESTLMRIEPGDWHPSGLPERITDASGTRRFWFDESKWTGISEVEWESGLLAGFKLDFDTDERGRPQHGGISRDGLNLGEWTMTSSGSGARVATLTVQVPGAPEVQIEYPGTGSVIDGAYYTVDAVQNYRIDYGRDAAGRIDDIDTNVSGFDLDWQRDALGRISPLNSDEGTTTYTYHDDNGSLATASGPDGSWEYTFANSGELTALKVNGTQVPLASDGLSGALTGMTHERNYLLSGNIHTNATVNVYLNGSTNAVHTVSQTNRYERVIRAIDYTQDPNELIGIPWKVEGVLPGAQFEGGQAVAWLTGKALIPPTNESVVMSGGLREEDAFLAYDWDAADRTNSITRRIDGLRVENVYDAENRRIEKRVVENGSTVRTHHFVYEGWLPVCEEVRNAAGHLLYRNLYFYGANPGGFRNPGQGPTAQLALVAHCPRVGPPKLSAPVYNHRWDISGLVDVETGTVVARYRYSPFGEVLEAKGSRADHCPFRFATAYYDGETETYNFGYRHFNPRTKQWISRDPIGERGGLNLFAYANNDPVNRRDQHGLRVVEGYDTNWAVVDGIPFSYIGTMSVDLLNRNTGLVSGSSSWVPATGKYLRPFVQTANGWVYPGHNEARWRSNVAAMADMERANKQFAAVGIGYWTIIAATPLIAQGAAWVGGEFVLHRAMAQGAIHAARAGQWGAAGSSAGVIANRLGQYGNHIAFELLDDAVGGSYGAMTMGGRRLARQGSAVAFDGSLFGRRVVGSRPGKAVLLGEYMPRVRAAADANPRFRVWPARNWNRWVAEGVETQKNIRWLRDQVRSGSEIYSLGKTIGYGRGNYYRAEVSELLRQGYRRRSAGSIHVPGYGNVGLYRWIQP